MTNKLLIIFLSFHISLTANASGAVAYSALEKQYFVVINKANKQEAIEAISNICQKEAKDCELIHATNAGGYGAIAKSTKNSGSSVVLGARSKQKAESIVLTDCNKKFGKCTISSSWQDVGRIVEVPVQQKILTGFGCVNPYTKLGDPYCERIDIGGNRY